MLAAPGKSAGVVVPHQGVGGVAGEQRQVVGVDDKLAADVVEERRGNGDLHLRAGVAGGEQGLDGLVERRKGPVRCQLRRRNCKPGLRRADRLDAHVPGVQRGHLNRSGGKPGKNASS